MLPTAQFEATVTRCLPQWRARAYGFLRDPDEAEDAVQDALLLGWSRLHQFRGTAALSTWLTTIVTRSALTALRRRGDPLSPRPRRELVALDEQIGDGSFRRDWLVARGLDPEQACLEAELRRRLTLRVGRLSPGKRRALECSFAGLSDKETARVLGRKLGTVKTALFRARQEVGERMRVSGISS